MKPYWTSSRPHSCISWLDDFGSCGNTDRIGKWILRLGVVGDSCQWCNKYITGYRLCISDTFWGASEVLHIHTVRLGVDCNLVYSITFHCKKEISNKLTNKSIWNKMSCTWKRCFLNYYFEYDKVCPFSLQSFFLSLLHLCWLIFDHRFHPSNYPQPLFP